MPGVPDARETTVVPVHQKSGRASKHNLEPHMCRTDPPQGSHLRLIALGFLDALTRDAQGSFRAVSAEPFRVP